MKNQWRASATNTYSGTYLRPYSSLNGWSGQAKHSVGSSALWPMRLPPVHPKYRPASLRLIGPRGRAALRVRVGCPLCRSAPASGPLPPPSFTRRERGRAGGRAEGGREKGRKKTKGAKGEERERGKEGGREGRVEARARQHKGGRAGCREGGMEGLGGRDEGR